MLNRTKCVQKSVEKSNKILYFRKVYILIKFYLWCFLFYQKMCILLEKIAILCLFLKNIAASKRVVYFILNNLDFPMVEGIVFYALYKSRVLIIPCKAEHFCLFIGLPNEIKKSRLILLSNFEVNFFIVLWSNLKKTFHY